MPSPKALPALLVAVALSACVDPKSMPVWELAGEPGLLYQVKLYYQHHAVEEGGLCTRPLFDGLTRYRVVEDTEDELVVDVAYYYRDMVRDWDDDCSRFSPTRCLVMARCRGFGERTFTIARTTDGPKIVDMSGPERATTLQP